MLVNWRIHKHLRKFTENTYKKENLTKENHMNNLSDKIQLSLTERQLKYHNKYPHEKTTDNNSQISLG